MGSLVRSGRTITRLIVVWLVGAVTVWILADTMPGFDLDRARDALFVSAAVGVLNAVVWPLLMRLALPVSVLTFGVGALLLNGLLVFELLRLIPGVRLAALSAAVMVALVVTAVTAATSSLLALDEDEFFHRRAARRARRRVHPANRVPGVVFLQIDGLGYDVLRHALRDGDAPTLARWLSTGTHRVVPWETDWTSQTGASQSGILHGRNDDIPAFRWYEKDTGRLLVCNRRADAAEIERRHSNGRGLLHAGGASRGNLFTGDATANSLTMSVAGRRHGRLGSGYYGYFANPSNSFRTVVGVLIEIGRELAAAAAQRRRGVHPTVPRGGLYPVLRALSTVASRDLVVNSVLDDIMNGRPVVYANFVGYDEVAHHSGIERYDSLAVLRSIDQQIGRLARAASLAPRPYRLVVLSDHGQSQGATFADRYGVTLDELVRRACRLPEPPYDGPDRRASARPPTDGADRPDPGAGPVARMLRRVSAGVEHQPEAVGEAARNAAEEAAARGGLLVLSSGNLGLIYFTDRRHRLTLEEIQAAHPGLLPTLVDHPGIGFLLVRTRDHGPVVLGRHGAYYLDDGRVLGVDPLAPYGPLAVTRVRRTDGFGNTADIMVNSMYDPQTDEVAAFEPLVGSHGGLGGPQTRPFLLFPADLPAPTGRVFGAERVHAVLRGWLAHLGHKPYAPRELPAPAATGTPGEQAPAAAVNSPRS